MIKCSEAFEVREVWLYCNNPASVIATDYKHGNDRGICAQCMIRLDKEDNNNFFNRHQFRGANC